MQSDSALDLGECSLLVGLVVQYDSLHRFVETQLTNFRRYREPLRTVTLADLEKADGVSPGARESSRSGFRRRVETKEQAQPPSVARSLEHPPQDLPTGRLNP